MIGIVDRTSNLFISYSHKDARWKDLLVTQLEVAQPSVRIWTDSDIEAGEDWHDRIDEALRNATAAVLLVSANSLTSKFILKQEVSRLLDRREREGLRIFPIIVRECAWRSIEWLARMQVRPRDGRALSGLRPALVDKELSDIVAEILPVIARGKKMRDGSG
jgi:hypothetical protein